DFIQELKIINKLDDETSNLAIGVRNDDDILYGIFQKLVANIDSDTKNKILNKYIFIKYEQSTHYKYLKEILAVVFLIIIIFLYIQYRLNKLNLELETKVSKKTSDLKYLNENLESKVKEQTFLLQQQNEKLKEAQSIAKIGSWSLDLSKNKLIWSDEIFNIFEIDKDKFEASYEGFISSIHPEDREMVHNTYTESLETKSPYSIKHRLLMNDGRIKWVIENCKTTFDDGQPQLSIGTIQDITKEYEIDIQLKNKEKQLYESEKMASLGEMIGNIAHQWRQPLSAISTAASGIQISKEYNTLTKEKEDELLKSIIDNTQYLSNTIDTFRDYIKEGKKLKEVILQDILNNAINITEASLKNNHIKLINNINSVEPIRITMVIKELPQVIINLINNAKDILIENNIDDKIITIDLIKKEDNIIISVEDNGGGVPNNIIDKIFEPYFTTKHKSQGTGLGLHMSYKIITESLDGRLWAQNTKNGAKFFIELPINTQ
ncbi:MAG: ATP-binding protein, partial [Campylobacterota bacterium]|nr:ATP-binding protein [Campylobacterota bacterium]